MRPKPFRLFSRAAAVLLLSVLTTMTAWADTETVSYIDADGNEQTVTATVLTGNEKPNQWGTIDLAAGWYVVKGNISYTTPISFVSYPFGTIHIILADGAQMAVDKNGNAAILLGNDDFPLAIYGQSAGTGRLSVTSDRNAIAASGGITINGGIVSATSTGGGFSAIYTDNGAITINGGQVTATPGDNAMGISTEGTITLGLRSASDFITANGYNGTVNIKDGQALKDPSGNIYYGTLTDAQKSAIANVTLQPATQAEFIAAALPQTAADTYTISDAAGWDAFCLALQDNDTWNRFSGKTVRLGDDITVTRMAGSSYHDFTGTFDGNGKTLTFNYTTTENYAAPFRNVESGCVIKNLHVSGTINTSAMFAAGLVGDQYGAVTIRNCRSSVTINSTISGDGTHAGFVARNGNGSGSVLTIEGCVFDGRLLGPSTSSCGGFIGWRYKDATITNSLFAPAEVTVQNDGSATFARNKVDTYNSYYTYYLCDGTNYAPYDPADADHPDKYNNGHATRTVTAADDVTIEAVALTGTATQYTVSGITAYSGGGLQRGETLYYGSGDQLSLTLSNSATPAPRGYQYGYTASAGTLSGSTLTMPDEDVTISVNTAALATIDWATVNQGTSADPYMIYNKDQLLLLAHRVNGTNGETANDYEDKYFKLGADITFTHAAVEGVDYAENYEAIGGKYNSTWCPFKGNFDGDNHTVSGIRIRKTGSGDADLYQGLFGYAVMGANIRNVHLTDARITGYGFVGGIVGLNNGTVSGCTVTDSYITATEYSEYGTICGSTFNTSRLRNNYYHGCSVNGTAVTFGKGCGGSDIADNNGALPAYAIALGANITTPPGTFVGQTEWLDTPPVGARLAPENGFTLAGNHYFASGYKFTPGSTLASGAAQGYTPRATLGGQLLDLYTHTGDAPDYTGTAIARLTVTADCDGKTLAAALISDGLQHEVSYIDAHGKEQTAQAIALDGTESSLGQYEQVTWYFVGADISHTGEIYTRGSVNIILTDGKTMSVVSNSQGFYVNAPGALTIYGQALGTGTLNATGSNYGIYANYDASITISGGTVTATGTGSNSKGIYSGGSITISGGTVTATSDYGDGISTYSGSITISGGRVTATSEYSTGIFTDSGNITLGCTTASDFIYASSYGFGPNGGTLNINRELFDEDGNSYSGTYYNVPIPDGVTLRPLRNVLALYDSEDNSETISGSNEQQRNVILYDRTLYKDGAWNTLCLPFNVTVSGSVLDGTGVEVKTLTSSAFEDGTLTLSFSTTSVATLTAGVPYIIRWTKPEGYEDNPSAYDLVNPVFTGVTVSSAPAANETVGSDYVDFVGTYQPASIYESGDEKHNLYLGTENKLYYPTAAGITVNAFRGYFRLKNGLTAGEDASGDPASGVRAFALNFDDETTGISDATRLNNKEEIKNNDWYTLDGRKLNGKPTKKGLYIVNGRKVMVK